MTINIFAASQSWENRLPLFGIDRLFWFEIRENLEEYIFFGAKGSTAIRSLKRYSSLGAAESTK